MNNTNNGIYLYTYIPLMQFRKIHFFILLLINMSLPAVIILFGTRPGYYDYINLLWIAIAILVLSFIIFFISWFLYYIITRGKDPSVKFHLLTQCFTTLLIVSFFCWIIIPRYYPGTHESNISHNKFFLETVPDGISNKYDTLYQRGFVLLEQKMDDPNDIRIALRVKKSVTNIITGNVNEEVCVFYFTYHLKDHKTELASKHIVGNNTNRLVFCNIPVVSLPELQALIDNKNTSIEESLSPGVAEKIYRETILPHDSLNTLQ